MKISLATSNPTKLRAVTFVFEEAFPGERIDLQVSDADPTLPEQPMDEEILRCARARASACAAMDGIDCGVGIEAGLMRIPGSDRYVSVQFCVLRHQDGREFVGMGPGYELPAAIESAVRAGEPLRKAFERILKTDDDDRRGAVFHLSEGTIDRFDLTIQALRMALLSWRRSVDPGV